MPRLLKIDRALYEVNDGNRTYRFLERNPKWRELSKEESEANKKSLDGYTRKFSKTGKMKVFHYKEE
ncbi:MAG: hypothetical protein V1702_01990 [Candidatus Woesearchaeota archaeon]